MTVENINSGNASIEAIRHAYTTKKDPKSDEIGRDAFMAMLVAQLKNQDPLSPLDGTDFATQLAQFTSLEQAMNMNESLAELVEVTRGKSAASSSLDYIGKVIRAESDAIEVAGGNVVGGFFTLEDTGNVAAVIYDVFGREIRHIYQNGLDAGTYDLQWDGRDESGVPVPDGKYTYRVAAKDENGAITDVPTSLQGEVSGVGYKNGKTYLVVGSGQVDPEAVISVSLRDESDLSDEKELR